MEGSRILEQGTLAKELGLEITNGTEDFADEGGNFFCCK